MGRGCEGVMLGERRETRLGGLAWGIGTIMPWLLAQRTDREVCMQSTMKLSVVKVAPGGPRHGCWVGVGDLERGQVHPLRECGVLASASW